MGWPQGWAWWGSGEGGTFEKVDSKASLVNGPVGDELEPEAAGRALDVVGLLVATEAPDEGAALAVPVPHLQVVVGAAVVALDLGEEVGRSSARGDLVAQPRAPEALRRWAPSWGVPDPPQRTGR